jgi:hypothetical protein
VAVIAMVVEKRLVWRRTIIRLWQEKPVQANPTSI